MPKILLVEDDQLNRELIERLLQISGFEVISAADGARGMILAHDEQPDLILMDMGLPVLNGWLATSRLKSLAATSRIPVIALTAYAMESDREHCLAVGCDDYDEKPIELGRLLGKIRACLDGAAAV